MIQGVPLHHRWFKYLYTPLLAQVRATHSSLTVSMLKASQAFDTIVHSYYPREEFISYNTNKRTL